MAGTDNRQQDLGDGLGSGAGRTGEVNRAEDLRGFLQQLSNQFADADRRHSESMRDMRERLARLGDQTIDLKEAMPGGFEADLERLETGMLQLAKRMADAEQPRSKPSAVEPTVPMHAMQAPAETVEPSRGDSWAVTPPPALKSAVMSSGAQTWSRMEPAPAVEPAATVPPPLPKSDDEPWDKTSADALASLYESGDPALPEHRHPLDVDPGVPSLALQAPREVLQTPAAVQTLKSTAQSDIASAALSNHFAVAETSALQRSEADRQWLESQLADLAHRVESSLAELKPDRALADLNHRFDQLEERWNSALTDVATRSDVEGLKIVEAHIIELTQKLEQAQAQFARLDAIEAQIADVVGQLSDDQIVQLFGGLVPTEEDLSRFAEAAAEKVAARIIAEMPQAAAVQSLTAPLAAGPVKVDFPPALEANQIEANERITQLHELLQGFIEERRRTSAETAEALDTMQQAMQHVLDRVDSLEMSAPHAPAAHRADAQLADVASHLEQTMPMAAARMAPEPPAAPVSGQDIYEEAKAAARAAAAAAGRGAQPGQGSKLRAQHAQRTAEPSLDASAAELQGDVEVSEERSKGARGGAAAGRNSVLENARRAAERARVTSAASEEQAPKGKASLLGKVRGDKTDLAEKGKSAGVRPSLMIAGCSMLLALAGYWFFIGSKHRPLGNGPRLEQSAPAAKSAQGAASRATPVAVEEESEKPAKEGKAAGGEKADEKQDGPKEDTRDRRLDRRSESPAGAPSLKQTADAPVEGQAIQGIVMSGGPGIAVQHSPSVSQADIMRAREQMSVAALSHRTAQNAAQGAMPAANAAHGMVAPVAPVMPVKLNGAVQADAAQAAPIQAEGKTVLELPPALVGPLSLRLAAAKGDPSAQFEIAARFAEGKGVKQDFGQAAAWYQRAANQGLAIAQYRLAALYERGLGVKPDPARARIWYKRAAEQGNVKAMHNLAVLSAGRDQSSPDYPSAVQWFTEAAERGLPDSQYNLGVLYESGLGVAKDPLAAYKWYALAARSGDREAARRYELLRAKFDPLSLKAAEESVATWKSRPIENAANDAMAAGSAWKARVGTASE